MCGSPDVEIGLCRGMGWGWGGWREGGGVYTLLSSVVEDKRMGGAVGNGAEKTGVQGEWAYLCKEIQRSERSCSDRA